MAIANSYTNLKDLKEAYDEGTISAQAYNTVAIQLNETNDTADLDSEEWADYADYIQEAADSMEDFNDNMSDEEAKVVAKGIMKMNDAIDDLANNFDDWKDVLKKSTKGSEEYSKALKGTQKAVSNLLDVSEDYVSDDFIVEHLDDIEKAATGDAEAIDNLKAALAKDIIANIVISVIICIIIIYVCWISYSKFFLSYITSFIFYPNIKIPISNSIIFHYSFLCKSNTSKIFRF